MKLYRFSLKVPKVAAQSLTASPKTASRRTRRPPRGVSCWLQRLSAQTNLATQYKLESVIGRFFRNHSIYSGTHVDHQVTRAPCARHPRRVKCSGGFQGCKKREEEKLQWVQLASRTGLLLIQVQLRQEVGAAALRVQELRRSHTAPPATPPLQHHPKQIGPTGEDLLSSEFLSGVSRRVHTKEGGRETLDVPLSFHKGREGRDAVSDEMVRLTQDVQVHLGQRRPEADHLHLEPERRVSVPETGGTGGIGSTGNP